MIEKETDGRFLPLALAGVLLLSAGLHFLWSAHPMTVVLDEVYFGHFAMAQLRHEYFFDIHPPLGKLLYAIVGVFAGLDPAFTFPPNQAPLPDSSYLVLRVLPRLVGTLFPLLMFGVARELGLSIRAALFVALLVVFENATLLLSRFVSLDIFLLFFGFAAMWAYLRYRRTSGFAWMLLAGVSAGCALATKWTGLSFVALIGGMELVRCVRQPRLAGGQALAVLVVLSVAVYIATFAALFAIVTKYNESAHLMSPGFKAALDGSPEQREGVQPAGFGARFLELNGAMYQAMRETPTSHAYGSKWYSWPFMFRGLDYWAGSRDAHSGTRFARIMLIGNPVVWWLSTFAILFLLINLPSRAWNALTGAHAHGSSPWEPNYWFLCVAYALNMLPFVGIARVMFLYHYMVALMFAILALGWLLNRTKHGERLMAIVLVAAVVAFVFFSPLTYGLYLNRSELESRYWLESWR